MKPPSQKVKIGKQQISRKMKPPSGPQSVIWFLALNSYKHDSASLVASACLTSWLNYDLIFVRLCILPFLFYLYDDCLIRQLIDLDMQILHVTSPVGCLGAVVPIWREICQSLCRLWIRIKLNLLEPLQKEKVPIFLYLTSHIDKIVQVWWLASKVGRGGQEKFPGGEHRG